jgi:hypothetical protein
MASLMGGLYFASKNARVHRSAKRMGERSWSVQDDRTMGVCRYLQEA